MILFKQVKGLLMGWRKRRVSDVERLRQHMENLQRLQNQKSISSLEENSGNLKIGKRLEKMDSTLVKLIHYSSVPTELNTCSYLQTRFHEPSGLWFSVEGYHDDTNWKDWCLGENFHLENLAYKHEIKLKDKEINILHLYDLADIEYFTKEYGIEHGTQIDWRRLTKHYRGIIIAPYCWGCRLNPKTYWYYPFNCACGCIWDLSLVESFILLPQSSYQNTPDQYT